MLSNFLTGKDEIDAFCRSPGTPLQIGFEGSDLELACDCVTPYPLDELASA